MNILTASKLALMFLLSLGVYAAKAQGLGVNTTGSAANASAMLDVTSTTQGVLVPRMTATQRTAIVSPATGLLVYQTDATAGFYYYNGTVWASLNGGGSPTGSAGGDLTGTYPNPTLATSGVTSGSYGSASQVPTYTVDSKGRIAAASNTSIQIAATAVTSGTMATARLGSGTANSTTFLRGDNTWAVPGGGSASGYMWTAGINIANTATSYGPMSAIGNVGNSVAAASKVQVTMVAPSAFTIDKFYVNGFVRGSGSSNTVFTGTIYVNDVASTCAVEFTINSGVTGTPASSTTNNTSCSVAVSAGDKLYVLWTNDNPAVGYQGGATYSFHAN